KEEDEDSVVEGKDSQGATDVEVAQIVGGLARVEENSGDEKAGEGEEEIDAHPAADADGLHELNDRGGGLAGESVMADEDEQEREAAESVETADMAAGGAFGRGEPGMGFRHVGG